MSVLVIGRFKADPARLAEVFASHSADFLAVKENALAVGAMHHRFAAGDGEVFILDEWPDATSFQSFFASQPLIAGIMAEAGVEGPPEFTIVEAIDSPDQF